MRATIQTIVNVLQFSGHNFTFHENKNINESIFASNIFSQQAKDKQSQVYTLDFLIKVFRWRKYSLFSAVAKVI